MRTTKTFILQKSNFWRALICMTHRKKGVGWHFSQYKGDNFYENVIK